MRTKLRPRTWVAIVIIVALGVPAVMSAPSEWRGAVLGALIATVITMLALPSRWNPN